MQALALLTLLAASSPADFAPDPLSVQRFEKGYRYPQAGWVVLHLEGEPYDRGYQHGRLMATEIAGFVRCFAAQRGHKDPEGAWKQTRTLANALFLRGFDAEYLEEMKGIADGAAAAGAKFDSRPIDLIDIAAVNLWPEIETLDDALEARPTGLEGKVFRRTKPRAMPQPKPDHCSAFAATGPATADGQIVFGHITMFSLYASNHFNVWLDVQPTKGHRVLMQSYPGGIQSGMDYYISASGLMVTETTIAQTRYEPNTRPLASRIRKALQYANSIDDLTAELTKGNNGLYTNEWLIGDAKTNEIAMLELGSKRHNLRRSSKGEWYGGTEGFYWGCNNAKDLELRLETIPSVHDRPANLVWKPSDRDATWRRLFDKHKGKITADFGREAFTTAPLAAYHSLDAKYTTTAMAKQLKTWALFGPPLGKTWEPSNEERTKYPEIKPLVSNPWTVLHPAAPSDAKPASVVKDIHDKVTAIETADDDEVHTQAAWHGTLLPKTDADAWLAAAFSEYEKHVALEYALRDRNDGALSATDRERLAVELNAHRSRYLVAARRVGDVPLAATKETRDRAWYDIASGKGVLALNEIRKAVGAARFDELMDKFGRKYAGQPAALNELFGDFVTREGGIDRSRIWDQIVSRADATKQRGAYAIQSFHSERHRTLIVYGTADEEAANVATAKALQELIRTHWSNETVPIKADRDVGEADAREHHLILIGRPDCNAWVEKCAKGLPVAFGRRSFTVGGEQYANAGTAVLAAADNPMNPRYSVVVLAGLSAEATARTPEMVFAKGTNGADVLIAPYGGKARPLVSGAVSAKK